MNVLQSNTTMSFLIDIMAISMYCLYVVHCSPQRELSQSFDWSVLSRRLCLHRQYAVEPESERERHDHLSS
jgi:hypothetical protein